MLNPIAFIPDLEKLGFKGCCCGWLGGEGTGECECGWLRGIGYPEKK
jgi:hypothetical protein